MTTAEVTQPRSQPFDGYQVIGRGGVINWDSQSSFHQSERHMKIYYTQLSQEVLEFQVSNFSLSHFH
jgi:hypothetical protein